MNIYSILSHNDDAVSFLLIYTNGNHYDIFNDPTTLNKVDASVV
jgi:hypothetical protein